MNENNNLIFESENQNDSNIQPSVSEMAAKKSKGNKGLIIILILIIVLLAGFIVYDKFISNNDTKEEEKQTTEVEDTTKKEDDTVKKEEITTVQKTDEEIVKELYIEKLKEPRTQCKITDYTVDNIKIVTGEERKQIIDMDASSTNSIYQDVSDKDIFATVTFSEKFENIDEPGCLAGNGEEKDGWLVNESRVLYIKYENGNYKIASTGTGW